MATARRMWQLYEPIHAVTYFAPEARAAADAIGMLGFWMGYFAMRSAPLGPVGPAVVTALFHGFPPSAVARALPDAWSIASPEQALQARLDGAAAALRGAWATDVTDAADLAWAAAQACDDPGRALGAANRALARPDDPVQRLWQATSTLREHRGDGHVAALVAHGVGPVEAHLLKSAGGESDPAYQRRARAWPAHEWDDATVALQRRGWLDSAGRLTAAGRDVRDAVERATDLAAETPWRVLGGDSTARLADLLRPLAEAVVVNGTIPIPNPVGMVWPPE